MEALKSYAHLEFEVSLLLRSALAVEHAIASAIFYNISNTRARYAIIKAAFEINHPDTFAKSWPKIERWLTPRDTARNHIIHWGQDTRITVLAEHVWNPKTGGKETLFKEEELGRLTNRARIGREQTEGDKAYTEEELRAEIDALSCMEIIVRRYHASVTHPAQWPWTDRFQQRIENPTPEEFLQSLNVARPSAPPQSSPQ